VCPWLKSPKLVYQENWVVATQISFMFTIIWGRNSPILTCASFSKGLKLPPSSDGKTRITSKKLDPSKLVHGIQQQKSQLRRANRDVSEEIMPWTELPSTVNFTFRKLEAAKRFRVLDGLWSPSNHRMPFGGAFWDMTRVLWCSNVIYRQYMRYI